MKSRLKKIFEHFFLINDTPHKIAAGAALGVFFGIIPGEGIATTLIVASILRFNRLAALSGVLVTNMWSTVLILPPTAIIGAFLFNDDPQNLISEFHRNYYLGFRFFLSKIILFDLVLPLIAGFFIIAGIISISIYFLFRFLLKSKKIKFLKEKSN